MNVLHEWKDEKGKTYQIFGDIDVIANHCKKYLEADMHEEDGEYSLNACQNTYDKHPTELERQVDVLALKTLLVDMQSSEWWEQTRFRLATKKNGTLHKNRTHELWLGHTFAHLWEDSYGYNTPYVRIQNLNDYQAEVQVGSRVVKW